MDINYLFFLIVTNIAEIPVPALMTLVVIANLMVVGLALWIVGRCVERRDGK